MKKIMLIINPTSGGEKALDYKEKLENKAKKYFEQKHKNDPKPRQREAVDDEAR